MNFWSKETIIRDRTPDLRTKVSVVLVSYEVGPRGRYLTEKVSDPKGPWSENLRVTRISCKWSHTRTLVTDIFLSLPLFSPVSLSDPTSRQSSFRSMWRHLSRPRPYRKVSTGFIPVSSVRKSGGQLGNSPYTSGTFPLMRTYSVGSSRFR